MTYPVAVIIIGTILYAAYAWRFNERMGELALHAPMDSNAETCDIVIRYAQPAHAARAHKFVDGASERFSVALPTNLHDIYNHGIDTTGKHLGIVSGQSCTHYGLKDGDLFLGDPITEADHLREGDFVVVDAMAEGSNVRHRIRRISKVGNLIEFNDDEKGKPHRARNRSEIIARITHILA